MHKKIVKYQAKCDKGRWSASKCEKKIGAQLAKRSKYTRKIDKSMAAVLLGVSARKGQNRLVCSMVLVAVVIFM